MAKRFPNMATRYSGPLRLLEDEFKVDYGKGRTIFVEHMNDLFAKAVPNEFIERVLEHCCRFPENTYVFQSKNPERFSDYGFATEYPPKVILGTTIESQYFYPEIMRKSPRPMTRYRGMRDLVGLGVKTFITIEPVLDFDMDTMMSWLLELRPNFVNIGADSKGTNLPEPSAEKVRELIEALKAEGIEIREKHNLARILK